MGEWREDSLLVSILPLLLKKTFIQLHNFMTRIQAFAERNVFPDAPNVITVAAGTATQIFKDETRTRNEIAYRWLQNVGANALYYSFGVTDANGLPSCDALKNFHGYVAVGQQLDCSQFRGIVSVYSAAGTTVATTLLRRVDTQHHN